MPERSCNPCQANLLNLTYHRPPEVSEIGNLLADDDSFKGLSDVKDFMRIDIDIDDWITKIKKG